MENVIKKIYNRIYNLYDHIDYMIYEYRIKREFYPGSLVMSCSYHPALVIENDGYDLEVLDLITYSRTYCSIIHCGIYKIDMELLEEVLKTYKKEGDRGLAIQFGNWTKEDYDKFAKEWKP